MLIATHSKEEWLSRKASIEDLYLVQRCTMRQVCDYLCETNFHVNIRMVKNRLLEWNLHKKLSLDEVRAALELIGPDKSLWPCASPQFRIRRRVVSVEEVIHSCRRRGFKQPFDLLQHTISGRTIAPEVMLLESTESDESQPETTEPGSVDGSSVNNTLPSHVSKVLVTDDADGHGQMFDPRQPIQALQASNRSASKRLQNPEVYQLEAQAIYQLRSFCLNYMMGAHGSTHKEPLVHQFTSHARLQNHLNEGLFYFTRSNFEAAFANFKLGFVVLEEVLLDAHPMAMSMYLMLLCSLAAKQADMVARTLLKHTLDMLLTHKQAPIGLLAAIRILYRSEELLEMPLLCLQVVLECMVGNDEAQWKGLYIKERYCDALYHAHNFGEAAVQRQQLLEEQSLVYKPYARNVLFTALNVADDHLIQFRFEDAETCFRRVLEQSERLSGFDCAKIRVVALSGLARTLLARVRRQCHQPNSRTFRTRGCKSPLQDLDDAADLVENALKLAEIWFDSSARRVQVLYDLQADIQNVSSSLG